MARHRIGWLIGTLLGLGSVYILGVVVRGHYGIAVDIHNASGHTLERSMLRVERDGTEHDLGDLAPGKQTRTFIQPVRESHIVLKYQVAGVEHTETIVGYVESGYCGKAEVTVLADDRVVSKESIDLVLCKRSWLDFY